jgi:hypothetical protein
MGGLQESRIALGPVCSGLARKQPSPELDQPIDSIHIIDARITSSGYAFIHHQNIPCRLSASAFPSLSAAHGKALQVSKRS